MRGIVREADAEIEERLVDHTVVAEERDGALDVTHHRRPPEAGGQRLRQSD